MGLYSETFNETKHTSIAQGLRHVFERLHIVRPRSSAKEYRGLLNSLSDQQRATALSHGPISFAHPDLPRRK